MPNPTRAVVVGASPYCTLANGSTDAADGAPAASQRSPQVTRTLAPPIQTGLIAGMLGYVVAAVFFASIGMIEGRSTFDIATVLRGTLFMGTPTGADAMIVTGPVFAYNGPRLVTFLVAGVLIAWLASVAQRAPQVWLVAFMLLLFVAAPVLGVPTVFELEVQAALPAWVITTAMTVAALAMALYLRHVYPALRGAAADAPQRRAPSRAEYRNLDAARG